MDVAAADDLARFHDLDAVVAGRRLLDVALQAERRPAAPDDRRRRRATGRDDLEIGIARRLRDREDAQRAPRLRLLWRPPDHRDVARGALAAAVGFAARVGLGLP